MSSVAHSPMSETEAKAGAAVPGTIEALARAWAVRDPEEWKRDPLRHREYAKQAIALGSPGLAFDMSSDGLAQFSADRELRYLTALALANSGSNGRAVHVLQELLGGNSDGQSHVDALSLAGRIAKERWAKLPEGPERSAAGEQARSWYQGAFEASRDPFPGINAASMSVLTGFPDEGRRIAGEVRDLCSCIANDPKADRFWSFATLGEACLLLNDYAAAADWYRKAVEVGPRRFGDMASIRRQVKLLSPAIDPASAMLEILSVPRVAVFTGHMIDSPGRKSERFPEYMATAVAEAIAHAISTLNLGFGYCSAACGADILFAEKMLERGAEVHIVLPFRREEFVQVSVAFAGQGWVERFERVMARAASVSYCVEESYLGDEVLFAYATQLTSGLATLRSGQLETEAIMLAVAEPGGHAAVGGTASNVQYWEAMGRRVEVLDLRKIRESAARVERTPNTMSSRAVPGEIRPPGLPWGQRQIRTMLFADMVGFSKLREHETPQFFVQFLGAISLEIEASDGRPVFGNTWGDGLYLVFENAVHAADFGLRLRDRIAAIDWRKCGLLNNLDIRIGMHTGPVFRALDPVIRQENFFGSQVTRAARIEPVAAPGSVYLSEQLAAVLAASKDRRFACDYLGSLELSKKFGRSRMYRLRRAAEAE